MTTEAKVLTPEDQERAYERKRAGEVQAQRMKALADVMANLKDDDSKRRIAKVMLVEVEKDQAGALEKVLGQVMRGNMHAHARYHLDYFLDLEPIANRLREESAPEAPQQLKPRVV